MRNQTWSSGLHVSLPRLPMSSNPCLVLALQLLIPSGPQNLENAYLAKM